MDINKSPLPAYYRIQKDIEKKIENHEYTPGNRIPSDKEFCEIYDVSRITVRRALSELEDAGFVERIQGKGTYVKFSQIKQSISSFYSFTDELIKMGYKPSSKLIKFEKIRPSEIVKNNLDLDTNENVFLLERLRLADGVVVAIDRSFIPEKYIPNFNTDLIVDGSLYLTLEKYYGFVPNNSEETIEAIVTDDLDSLYLDVTKGTPALLIKRISFYGDLKVEFNYRIVNSKRFKYSVILK